MSLELLDRDEALVVCITLGTSKATALTYIQPHPSSNPLLPFPIRDQSIRHHHGSRHTRHATTINSKKEIRARDDHARIRRQL